MSQERELCDLLESLLAAQHALLDNISQQGRCLASPNRQKLPAVMQQEHPVLQSLPALGESGELTCGRRPGLVSDSAIDELLTRWLQDLCRVQQLSQLLEYLAPRSCFESALPVAHGQACR